MPSSIDNIYFLPKQNIFNKLNNNQRLVKPLLNQSDCDTVQFRGKSMPSMYASTFEFLSAEIFGRDKRFQVDGSLLSAKNIAAAIKQVFNFNKGLKKDCKYNADYFALDGVYYKFYIKFFNEDNIEPIDNKLCLNKKIWKKEYDSVMSAAKQYITDNQQELLDKLNNKMLKDAWNKYAAGTISHWEMESLGMYYHKHELTNIDNSLYDIVDYTKLDRTPIVDYTFKRNGVEIPIFKTFKIAGTVIAKDEMHSQITLLTTTGVVEVKMSKEYFSQYNKRISEVRPDGTKKIMEQGFFQRGTMLVCNGIRRGDTFVLKAYKRKGNVQHQLYKITKVNKDGTIEMTNNRYGENVDN